LNEVLDYTEKNTLKRVILFLDGEYNQTYVLMNDVKIDNLIKSYGYELMKLAAACSKTQQPNDKMRSFMILHQLYRSTKYLNMVMSHVVRPSSMDPVDIILGNVTTSSKRTFSTLSLILSTAYTESIILDGWRKTVLAPLSSYL
jgi:hypothetical protein